MRFVWGDQKKMGELRSELMNRERRASEKRGRDGTLLFVCFCENISFVIVEKKNQKQHFRFRRDCMEKVKKENCQNFLLSE